MAFRFKKNARGYSDITFPFMRKTIIPTTRYLFSPKITNRHNIPVKGPCFIYGNHSNYFDPFFVNLDMTEEPTAGVMTRDQFHKTIPRIFMDSIGIVPTSKYVPEPAIVRNVIKMIQQERMIVIFPEGGRRWDGQPKPLIETTLKLFWKMGIPVHPVQFHGSHLSWPRWADKIRKSSVEIRWRDPLHPSDYEDYETFAGKCRENLMFDEYNPPETVDIYSCSKPASGIHRLLYRCPDTGQTGAVFSPDGKSVYSRASDMSYKMDLHSRLIDAEGQVHSLAEMFEHINNLPIVIDQNSVVLSNLGCNISKIDERHQLIDIGPGYLELGVDSILISHGSNRKRISLEYVRYLSVEQNHKITMTTDEGIFQITLRQASALQWRNYIFRLKKGEQPVRSML